MYRSSGLCTWCALRSKPANPDSLRQSGMPLPNTIRLRQGRAPSYMHLLLHLPWAKRPLPPAGNHSYKQSTRGHRLLGFCGLQSTCVLLMALDCMHHASSQWVCPNLSLRVRCSALQNHVVNRGSAPSIVQVT